MIAGSLRTPVAPVVVATLAFAGCVGVGHGARMAATEPVADPVRVMLASPEAEPPGRLIRIVRDYNNDGRADVALGWEGTCGNKTCSFELFLQTPDGRYRRVGTLGGLPFAYRIVPLGAGTARLETCVAIGGEVSYGAVSISMNGVAEEPGRSLSEVEARETCTWSEQYVWETCDVDRLSSEGACSWTRRTWPR
jgi:hypothetical protein